MVKVKSLAVSKKNYEDSTALVPGRFESGVREALWHDAAIDGQDLYVAKMTDPAVLARRARAIETVSDEQWRTETITKGKGVIGARMKAASPKWQAGWAPYRAALESVVLPAKTVDPLANVTNRVGAVVAALVAKKEELLG